MSIGLSSNVWAQPANDNFTNAQVIFGPAGSVTGANTNATHEGGEPFNCGIPGGFSIWFAWTNSTSGAVTFNTEGSDFDTTLGVYSGTSVGNLVSVGCNDDVAPPVDVTSSVTFNATAGTVYYISVDGFGSSQGHVILNWSAAGASGLTAGSFRFTSGRYIYSESESIGPRNGFMRAVPGRLTVTRTAGAVGRVQVGYNVTSLLYTNIVITSVFGTNITQMGGGTNYYFTNSVETDYLQNNDYGTYDYYQIVNFTNWSFTNINGFTSGSVTISNNVGTNFPAPPPVFFCNTSVTSTDVPPFTTNIFCTNYIVTNFVPSANFAGAGGVTNMDDFQMSADIFLAIGPSVPNPIMVNQVIVADITNAVLDPLESSQITPPTVGSISHALVTVLNQRMVPGTFTPITTILATTPLLPPGFVRPLPLLDYNQPPFATPTNVVNFERATLRCSRNVNGQRVAHVAVTRTLGDPRTTITVPWRIDYYAPLRTDNGNNAFAGGGFPALQAGSDYAAPPNPASFSTDTDYEVFTGTITFPANNVNPQFIDIPITNNDTVEFNEDLAIELYYPDPNNPPTDWRLGYVFFNVLTILFDDIPGDAQPAGAKDRTYNPDNDPNTVPPYNLHPGANNVVYSLVVQPDGKTVLGGEFTAYNTTNANRLVRVNLDGSIDRSFNALDGADGFVSALALDSFGKIIAGGAFSSINRTPRLGVARLTSSGALDTTFFPGLGASTSAGPNGQVGTVWAVAVQSDGHILIGGEFTFFNGTNRAYVARLNTDGSLDTSFDPGGGPNGFVHALAVQSDGRVLIGGEFSTVDSVSRNGIARLNADGSLDTTFNPGDGANGIVYALALQPDGRVVLGGDFNTLADISRNSIGRLNSDGSPDASFDPGSGANDTVYSISLQTDGGIILGGIFTSFNQTRRIALARLFTDGTVDTSFMDMAYNQFAGLITHYWDPNQESKNFVFASGLQPDGNVMIAGGFTRVGGGVTRDDVRIAHYATRVIGGSTPGPGNISLNYPNYTADLFGQQSFVSLTRTNGHLGPASATVSTVALPSGPGAAVPGADYTTTSANPEWIVSWSDGPFVGTWQLQDGIFAQNQGFEPTVDPGLTINSLANDVYIPIINNTNTLGNRSLNLQVSNPNAQDLFFLGGQEIPLGVALGRYTAPMTIVDSRIFPGVLGFSFSGYVVNEGGTNAVITVTRTNGTGGIVSVICNTLDGTATNNIHYRSNYARLNFNPGDTTRTFTVPIIDEFIVDGDHTVRLKLSAPTGGAALGISNAILTIQDNDIPGGYVQFGSTNYGVNEDAGFALVTFTRNGSGAGTLNVQFATSNQTAVAFANYIPVVTNLTWNNGNSQPQTVAIPILDDGIVETSNLTVGLRLSGATLNTSPDPQALIGITNATLFITNRDFTGQLGFSTPAYTINEGGGFASITVVRTGGSAGAVSVNFATLNNGAVQGVNYLGTNGTLIFAAGEVSKTFNVPILDDGIVDTNVPFAFNISLSNLNPIGTLGAVSNTVVNILDSKSFNQPPGSLDTSLDPLLGFNDAVRAIWLQTDGRILAGGDFTFANGLVRNHIARLNYDGSLDTKFSSTSPAAGANGPILAILSQTDLKVVVGGQFTTFNSANRNYLARLNFDSSLDSTFNPGAGPDNTVYTVVETFSGTNRVLLIGGAFLNYNSKPSAFVARLTDTGALDPNFSAGSANGPVFAIAVQPDGKALIGGDFTTVNGIARAHIARLNTDGSLDLGFDPGGGPSDSVRSIAVQLDGRIVIGGLFTTVGGTSLNHIARLTARGAVDPTFTPGVGADDVVSSISLQPDTRIVLGGQFTRCNGVTRGHITRLNNDGTADTMINFGLGANSFVAATAIQTNGMILLGGGFTTYDGHPINRLARIYGGTIAGAGSFEFDAANYYVTEDSSNTVVTVRRRGGTSAALSNNNLVTNVSVTFLTSDFTAVAGVNYSSVTTNMVFPPGEVVQTVNIPIIHDFVITPDLLVRLTLTNASPVGTNGPVLGNQPGAYLTIINVDSGVSFSQAAYAFPENALTGSALIPVVRTGSTNGTATVIFLTVTNGSALPGVNYVAVSNIVTFPPGLATNFVQVPLIDVPGCQGDKSVLLELTNANNSILFAPSLATLTIQDVDHCPGQLVFSQTNYVVGEGAGFLVVPVIRTNGHSGQITANFSTLPGTAVPGVKYVTTNGVLTFAEGETNKAFNVQILEENAVEGNQTFSLVLSNATGGATLLAPTNVPATIIDDDVGLAFSSAAYVTTETNGAVAITVVRANGTNGFTTISYATTDHTSTNLNAQAGTNYLNTSGTLTFNPGETVKSFNVTILHDPRVTGTLEFGVNLSDPSPPAQLALPSSTIVIIQDVDAGIGFTNANYGVFKSGTNILINIVRSNANTGIVSANFTTTNGTAVAGVDYIATNGVLTFSNGIDLQTISVPIINNQLIEGDRFFNIRLLNPQGAQLDFPSTTTVTITDDVSGLSFSSAVYTTNETAGLTAITVLRSDYTNSVVSVNYSTADGTGKANVNYLPTSGLLTFTNGETVKTFNVTLIDDGILNGDKSVLLGLSNLVGNAVLVNPNSAVINVLEADGSLIVPSGSALVHESGPVNGVIDPGETVTMLLALRNTSGSNTVNLTATMVSTNGVATTNGQTQGYGALVVHGPSVFRPFTFTASGTNGQTIGADLHLKDGATDLGNAIFSFTLGTGTNTFSNPAYILINDFSNATPYPSTISVSGVGGAVSKVTATLTNLNHSYPNDIDALLVGPTGQNTFLMAKCGSGNALNSVTLTFDDTASNNLPLTQITSGAYKPTSYAIAPPPFAAPAPPAPYRTNLSIFTNSNPNGTWSLYIIDDTKVNSGFVSNGWYLNFVTAAPILGAADLGITMSSSNTSVVVSNNLYYTLTVTNYGPSTASNVVVADTLPAGALLVSATTAQGSAALSSPGVVSWTIPYVTTNTGGSLTLVVQADAVGAVTNSAAVTSTTADPNPDDDTASLAATVLPPSADLTLSLIGTPNPVFTGNNLTYSITVTNAGPSVAPSLVITDTLPASVSFVSASPSGYSLAGNKVAFYNLGSLGVGGQANATIVVRPFGAGTITNTANTASGVLEPLKAHATASVKTLVESLVMTITQAGTNVVITWTSDASGFNLEYATNLQPPIAWALWTGPIPLINGQMTVTVPVTGSRQFFRLHGQGQ